MKLQVQVQQTWQKLSSRERKIIRSFAKGSPDAGLRVRCKIVLALVRGNSSCGRDPIGHGRVLPGVRGDAPLYRSDAVGAWPTVARTTGRPR